MILNKIKSMNHGKENYLKVTLHNFILLADTIHYVPTHIMAVTGNTREFTITGSLHEHQIHISRHFGHNEN